MSAAPHRPRAAARPAAVLWDMDGTLVDTEPYWIECEFELVERYGDSWDMEKAHSLVGHDLRDSARILQARGGVRLEVDDIVNRLLDGVIERVRRNVPWRPGARELLADLKAAGVPCAMVTMSWQRFADAVVSALPAGSFTAVISGDMVVNGKPHPEPYLTGASAMGARPDRCVAIEDSPTGVRSAVAAGCRTFAVPNVVDIAPGEGYTVVRSLLDIPRAALGLDGAPGRQRPAHHRPAHQRPVRPHPDSRRGTSRRPVLDRATAGSSPVAGAPTRRRRRPRRWGNLLALLAVLAIGAGVAYALRDDAPPPPLPDIPVNAWAPYWELAAATASINAHGATLHEVSPFWYTATSSGVIAYAANITAADTAEFAAAARASGAKVIPSVTDGTGKGLMATILANPVTRAQQVQALVTVADQYDGIDLDYEGFAFTDDYASWETTRPNWVAFVTELATALHTKGKLLVVTVPPVYDTGRTPDSGRWVYDPAAMGEVADAVRVMAYDYSTETPGPIAPTGWVKDIVRAMKQLVDDDSKIVLGIPTYGRNWVVSTQGTCPADVPGRVSPTQVEVAALLAEHALVATHDPNTGEASFTYDRPAGTGATACTQTREVHFVDALGVRDRLDIAREERIGGVALWAMGFETADTWAVIADVARPR